VFISFTLTHIHRFTTVVYYTGPFSVSFCSKYLQSFLTTWLWIRIITTVQWDWEWQQNMYGMSLVWCKWSWELAYLWTLFTSSWLGHTGCANKKSINRSLLWMEFYFSLWLIVYSARLSWSVRPTINVFCLVLMSFYLVLSDMIEFDNKWKLTYNRLFQSETCQTFDMRIMSNGENVTCEHVKSFARRFVTF